jgi:hypothetical protein
MERFLQMNDENSTAFSMSMDPRTKHDIEKIAELIGARTKAEAVRRMAHSFLKLLQADPTQNDIVVVLGENEKKIEVHV